MRSLGSKEEVEPDVYVNSCRRATSTCCAATGCGARVPDDKIGSIFRSTADIEAACQLLIDAANEAGGPDNITALLVRVG